MQTLTNPRQHLYAAPPTPERLPRLNLPAPVHFGRYVVLALTGLLLLGLLFSGTMESRITYLIAYLVFLANPVWGLYSLALIGPLCLLDQGKIHMLGLLEVTALGIIAGELRLLDRPPLQSTQEDIAAGRPLIPRRTYWGLWPYFLGGLFFLLLASSLVGLQLIYLAEQQPKGPARLLSTFNRTMWGAATNPEWTLKSLWNWATAMGVALVAARRFDAIGAARWMKLGAASLAVACGISLLSWADWISLAHIRHDNPDPLQAGRLQGLAGHPGWLGQWIVLMWPGLLLWLDPGRNKRNGLIGLSVALVGLCLVLTAARAAWLGALLAAAMGSFYLLGMYPWLRRYLPYLVGGGLLVIVAGVLLGGETLENRLTNLLRARDRINYYVTGLVFLREYPQGLGLGTHFLFYEWTFTPFSRFFQKDHVTAHSLWLHTLIENGPLVPAMLAGGLAGVFLEYRKARRLLNDHDRQIAIALGMSLLGIMAISVAQYVVYLRVVELAIWVAAGSLVGLCRQHRCRLKPQEDVINTQGPRLLLACGVAALIMASLQSGRSYAGQVPRHFDHNGSGGLEFWTGTSWRTPVDNDVAKVSFSLHRKATPVTGRIIWPDGSRAIFRLEPGDYKYFEWTQDIRPNQPFSAPRWLVIEADSLWTPAQTFPDNTDDRGLGVYVSDLRMATPGRPGASAQDPGH